MGRKEKLIKRLKSKPKDFTYIEMKTLLELLGYQQLNKGKTSGSRIMFTNENNSNYVSFHKPHPNNELPYYVIKNVLENLEKEGLI